LVTLEGRIATSTLRAHPRSMVRRAFRNVKTSQRTRRAGVPFTLRNYSQFIIQCQIIVPWQVLRDELVSPAASMHLCVCSLRPQMRRWETRVWVIRGRVLIRRWNIPQRKWVGLPSGGRGHAAGVGRSCGRPVPGISLSRSFCQRKLKIPTNSQISFAPFCWWLRRSKYGDITRGRRKSRITLLYKWEW